MASSQKMASLVTKIARTGVVAAPEAKWVPAQVRSNMLFIGWSGIDINDILMYAQFEMLRFCYPKSRNGCQQRSPFPGTLGKICLHSRWGKWNEKNYKLLLDSRHLYKLKTQLGPSKSVVQKPHRDFIAGPHSQPIAQGALELYCSHLQLQLHRTVMLGCDRKELNALLKTLRSIYGLGIKSPFDKTDFIDHFIICTRPLKHKIWCVLPISLPNADQTLRETAFVLSLSDQINLDHLQR